MSLIDRVRRFPSTPARRFAVHYAEMVLVMLAGMAVLAVPARWATDALWPATDGDDPTLMLARMAVTMTLPMVPWMRWRGHGWAPCVEMVAAMIVPSIGTIALVQAGLVDGIGLLMTIEHVAMFAAMFLVMAARPAEYAHGRCAGGGGGGGGAAALATQPE